LIVVGRDGATFTPAAPAAPPTLQAALDDWDRARPALARVAAALDAGALPRRPLDPATLASPLPRAYEWLDGSAYLSHVVLARKARGADPPATLLTDPLVYQGGSGVLLGPTEDIPLPDAALAGASASDVGLDFESEIAVVLGDTPRGTRKDDAAHLVRLVMLANDLTLRNLVPAELGKGFGFVSSKPATAFSPFAVTPDELGPAWRDGRVHLRLRTWWNGELVGDVDAGPEMHFSFFDLIEHIARTRSYTAGTILGSGTVSNADAARGVSCLAERRAREVIATGYASTRFMQPGDTVAIEMLDDAGRSVFGRLAQRVVARELRKGP
jgi:fumarylacetoacetate (FAA) hydrolase